MIVGHRGASHDAPENTLAAFQEAWRQGADGIEGDFYLTQDGEIVCIHDKDTLRTGGILKSVANSTLAQLRSLEYGSWKAEKFRGEPIPTLDDVLDCVPPGKRMVIEIKCGPEIVPVLRKQLLRRKTSLDQLLIISFNEQTIAAAKKRLPEVRAHWLTSYKQDVRSGQWLPTAPEIAKILVKCGADGLGTKAERAVVNQAFIDRLRKLGMREFHVWTVDAVEDGQFFQRLGAVGITTNRPGWLRQQLQPPSLPPK